MAPPPGRAPRAARPGERARRRGLPVSLVPGPSGSEGVGTQEGTCAVAQGTPPAANLCGAAGPLTAARTRRRGPRARAGRGRTPPTYCCCCCSFTLGASVRRSEPVRERALSPLARGVHRTRPAHPRAVSRLATRARGLLPVTAPEACGAGGADVSDGGLARRRARRGSSYFLLFPCGREFRVRARPGGHHIEPGTRAWARSLSVSALVRRFSPRPFSAPPLPGRGREPCAGGVGVWGARAMWPEGIRRCEGVRVGGGAARFARYRDLLALVAGRAPSAGRALCSGWGSGLLDRAHARLARRGPPLRPLGVPSRPHPLPYSAPQAPVTPAPPRYLGC